ncbi:AraC family transcriptional regulator [Acutalibacter sp. JLR.KK004]
MFKTDRNVAEIGADCGCSSLSNFNRQFRQVTGCSPAQYRKKFRSKEEST